MCSGLTCGCCGAHRSFFVYRYLFSGFIYYVLESSGKNIEREAAAMEEKREIDFEKYEMKMTREQRFAMERFANFMAEMILKYRRKVLAEIEAEEREKAKKEK